LIYPPELEVKETTDTASSASFLDLLQAFEETPTHMSIKINRLEEGHNKMTKITVSEKSWSSSHNYF
jgi:hypothetical protein